MPKAQQLDFVYFSKMYHADLQPCQVSQPPGPVHKDDPQRQPACKRAVNSEKEKNLLIKIDKKLLLNDNNLL